MKQDSKYLRLLPPVFQEPEEDEKEVFIGRYLKIFEKILSGIDDDELKGKKGISEILDIIPELFHPQFSMLFSVDENEEFIPSLGDTEKKNLKSYFRPELNIADFEHEFIHEFLGWLAKWIALVLKEDWELETKRKVVASIIPIYRTRGTKIGIQKFLDIYVPGGVKIYEKLGSFQVGESRIGEDTLIGGGIKAHTFTVEVSIPKRNLKEQERFLKNLNNVLEAEKPVHTSYLLKVSTITIEIGNREGSIVGVNTLIGGTRTKIKT